MNPLEQIAYDFEKTRSDLIMSALDLKSGPEILREQMNQYLEKRFEYIRAIDIWGRPLAKTNQKGWGSAY